MRLTRVEIFAFVALAIVVFGLGFFLSTVVQRRQQAAVLPTQYVAVGELEPDPSVWGKTFPESTIAM